jgi:hypothetical protein
LTQAKPKVLFRHVPKTPLPHGPQVVDLARPDLEDFGFRNLMNLFKPEVIEE